MENCDFVGQAKLFDTIYKKSWNYVTIKDRMDIQWNNFHQTSGAIIIINAQQPESGLGLP